MSLRLNLHVIVHTLLFYNIPRIYTYVYASKATIHIANSSPPRSYYITRNESSFVGCWTRGKKESCESWRTVSSSFLLPRKSRLPPFVCSILADPFPLVLFLRPKKWSRSTSNVNVRMCVQADYGLGYGLYLYWPTGCSNVDSRNGRNARCYSLVEVR